MNNSVAADSLLCTLNDYFRSACGDQARLRPVRLLAIPAGSIVCLGLSLSTPASLWRALGRGGGSRLLRDSLALLLRGRAPLHRLGIAYVPQPGRLFLIDKGKKKAFLLVDTASGSVVKAFPLPEKRAAFEHERTILGHLTAAGVSIAPRLQQQRLLQEDGLAWIRMSFHPNRRPVARHRWAAFRNRNLTPALFSMYRAVGPGMVDLAGYLDRICDAALKVASAEIVQYLCGCVNEFARRAGISSVYTALTHADIREGHVARCRHGWVLIDWGSADVRSVFYDLYVQERKAFKSTLDTKRRGRYPRRQIESMYRSPAGNLWTALRQNSPAGLDGFQSGWQHVFCAALEQLIKRPITADYLRCLVALAELERIAHNAGHKGTGDVCLYLLGAPIDISGRINP